MKGEEIGSILGEYSRFLSKSTSDANCTRKLIANILPAKITVCIMQNFYAVLLPPPAEYRLQTSLQNALCKNFTALQERSLT